MEEEYIKKIKSNILKGGFPTELEVAHIFNKRNWRVNHNTYFIDKDENKSREIDLISDLLFQHRTEGKYTEYTFKLIVEIKQEKTKPWVLFTSKTTKFEKLLMPTASFEREYSNCDWNTLSNSIYENSPKVKDRIGRSFTEGFSSGKDKIFNSLCNVTKALLFAKERIYKNKSDDRMITLIEPLIVIKGDLLEAFIDDKGELQVIEKEHIQFSFNYLSENYEEKAIGHIINVVKYEHLDIFLSEKEKIHKSIFEENKH
jgi:hypothetical protein